MSGEAKLTAPMVNMLRFYEGSGPTQQTYARGTMETWRALLRRGLLNRSNGLGTITTEITPAGLAALSQNKDADHG